MRKSYCHVAVLLLCLMLWGSQIYAWNDLGHMVTAFIAYQRLTDATRTRANGLIRQNPFFKRWLTMIPANTSDQDRDRMLFMIAATFADQIKGDPSYEDDGAPGSRGNRPDGPQSSLNIGYSDHLRHRYWHFIDRPFSNDGTTHLPGIPTPNVQTQIEAFRAVLASNADDDLKSYDLVWLLHLVGDAHQPLHAASRVSGIDPNGDNGGNEEKVCPVPPAPCNERLHHFWDRALDFDEMGNELAKALAIGPTLPEADSASAHNLLTSIWIDESFADAKSKVYVSPIEKGDGPFELTATYRNAARQEARTRIALAGARLAKVLNGELK